MFLFATNWLIRRTVLHHVIFLESAPVSTDSDTPTHLHGDRVVVLVVESHVPLALVRVQLPFVRHLDQVSRPLRHSRLRPYDTNTISLDCLKAFGVTDHEISRSQARRTKENSLLKVKTKLYRGLLRHLPTCYTEEPWLLFYGFVPLGRDNHFLQYEHDIKGEYFPVHLSVCILKYT